MSIPITVRAGAAGAYLVNATPAGDILVTAPQHAVLTRAEAEELADALCMMAHAGRVARAKPITGVVPPACATGEIRITTAKTSRSFGQIRPHHWETMVPQHAQDRYRERVWRARVWMRDNRQRLETAAMLRQVDEMQRLALFRRQALL